MRGRKLTEAAALAAKFVRDCAERTFPQGTPMREGVDFEPLLYTIGADRLCKGKRKKRTAVQSAFFMSVKIASFLQIDLQR